MKNAPPTHPDIMAAKLHHVLEQGLGDDQMTILEFCMLTCAIVGGDAWTCKT